VWLRRLALLLWGTCFGANSSGWWAMERQHTRFWLKGSGQARLLGGKDRTGRGKEGEDGWTLSGSAAFCRIATGGMQAGACGRLGSLAPDTGLARLCSYMQGRGGFAECKCRVDREQVLRAVVVCRSLWLSAWLWEPERQARRALGGKLRGEDRKGKCRAGQGRIS
jgi:hypothetical protein